MENEKTKENGTDIGKAPKAEKKTEAAIQAEIVKDLRHIVLIEDWKKTVMSDKGQEITLTFFRKIVKEAKKIHNRAFNLRIAKSEILRNVIHGTVKITAFNGFRVKSYGDQACYKLKTSIGKTDEIESLILYIQL